MFLYVCYITRNDILWRPESFLSITEDYISTIEFDCNDILSFLLFSKHPFTNWAAVIGDFLSSLETFLYVRNGSFQNWVTQDMSKSVNMVLTRNFKLLNFRFHNFLINFTFSCKYTWLVFTHWLGSKYFQCFVNNTLQNNNKHTKIDFFCKIL